MEILIQIGTGFFNNTDFQKILKVVLAIKAFE